MADVAEYQAAYARMQSCKGEVQRVLAQIATVEHLLRDGDLQADPDGSGLFIIVEGYVRRAVEYPSLAEVAGAVAELEGAKEGLEAAQRQLEDAGLDLDAMRHLGAS